MLVKAEGQDVNFPAALTRTRAGISASIPTLDGTALGPEMKNLLRIAASDEDIPNCDSLLYHPGNFDNWKIIAADPQRSGEENAIERAARAHALIVQPPKDFGFLSIGGGDMFGVKERAVIEEHVKQGHTFSFFAYSEINQASLDKVMEDGRRLAEELGLEGVKHIPLLGDIFTQEVARKFKEEVGDTDLANTPLIAASFGFMLQNLRHKVSGYSEAAKELAKDVKFIKRHYLPKGSTLFATFDQDVDRDAIRDKYTGQVHDDFTMSGVEHHLGKAFAEHGEIVRRFAGSTAIYFRDVVFSQPVAVNLGNDEILFFKDGKTFWNGISAKSPKQYVTGAFEDAKMDQVMRPVEHDTFACHVVCNPR